MPALGPGPVNDMAAIIGWVGRTGAICLSAIRLLRIRCLILRILRSGWRCRCEGANRRRRQDYGKQLFHSLSSYAQPANDQIRARVRVGINMRGPLG